MRQVNTHISLLLLLLGSVVLAIDANFAGDQNLLVREGELQQRQLRPRRSIKFDSKNSKKSSSKSRSRSKNSGKGKGDSSRRRRRRRRRRKRFIGTDGDDPTQAPVIVPVVTPTIAPVVVPVVTPTDAPVVVPVTSPTEPPVDPPGGRTICSNDGECSGSVCAREFFTTTSEEICCPSGEREAIGQFSYCTEQDVGAACGSNTLCASGVCINEICVAGKQATGATCDASDDVDCENAICAREVFDSASASICCTSGAREAIGQFSYCTEQAVGAACGSNTLCASGVCINELCVTGKQAAGETCDATDDDDCENAICAREVFDSASASICCTSGAREAIGQFSYCTEQAVGAACGSNTLCASGVCINELCVTGKQAAGETCDATDDDDCENAICAREVFDSASASICCTSGAREAIGQFSYCTEQAVGAACGSNTLCASGVCINELCVTGKQAIGEACDANDNDDCESGTCTDEVCA